MPGQRIKLCDACHKHMATYHVHESAAGRMQSIDLCVECFEAREPAEQKRLRHGAQTARCKYCAGTPCVEWNSLTNVFGFVVADAEPTGFLCAPCTEEYNRFLAEQMEGLSQGLSEPEESAIASRLREGGERHMLEWVARRRL